MNRDVKLTRKISFSLIAVVALVTGGILATHFVYQNHSNFSDKKGYNPASLKVVKVSNQLKKSGSAPLLNTLVNRPGATPLPSSAVQNIQNINKSGIPLVELSSVFNSWGVDIRNKDKSINLIDAWKNFHKKKDITVAVIDTGIDANHTFLKDNIVKIKDGFGVDFSHKAKNLYKPVDTHGHGTHVSGIIKSVYPQVKIMALKYYDPSASGNENLNSTIKALKYAVDQNVDIINFSGGGLDPSAEELRVLKEAEKKGIIVVAAAGNEKTNIDSKKPGYYPAAYGLENVISVTAYDQNLQLLASSNYGPKIVDIAAPGHRIVSALPDNKSGELTGTSQATAFVSGAIALIKAQYPNLTIQEIRKTLLESSKKTAMLAQKCKSAGILDLSNAVNMIEEKLKKKVKPIAITRQVAQGENVKRSSKNSQRVIVYRPSHKKAPSDSNRKNIYSFRFQEKKLKANNVK